MLKIPKTKAELFEAIKRGWTDRGKVDGRYFGYSEKPDYSDAYTCCAMGAAFIACGGFAQGEEGAYVGAGDFCHEVDMALNIKTTLIYDISDGADSKEEALLRLEAFLKPETSVAQETV
jgi:hypothetical protein